MPVYTYKCDNCGRREDQYRTMRNRNRRLPCGVCQKGLLERAFTEEMVNSTEQDYAKPVLSDAMGVHPSQIQEHKRLYPDIPITPDGRIECRSHAERKRIMKKLQFVDRDGYY